jgi:hypothetical protein
MKKTGMRGEKPKDEGDNTPVGLVAAQANL